MNKGWAQSIDEITFQKESAIQLYRIDYEFLEERKKVLESAPAKRCSVKKNWGNSWETMFSMRL